MIYRIGQNVFLLIAFLVSLSAFGQVMPVSVSKQAFVKMYGLDANLYNGRKYFSPHTSAKGHPYLFVEEARKGHLILAGKEYLNLDLKYNIYNQLIILEFENNIGFIEKIVVANSLIDTVYLFDRKFINNPFPEIRTALVQCVYEDSYSMYVSWKKEYSFKDGVAGGVFKYSKAFKDIYLCHDNTILKVKRKNKFYRFFDTEDWEPIRQYLKKHKIKFKKASDTELQELMKFCNDIK